MNKQIIKLLIIILLFLPILGFGAFDLENIYPKVPGTSLELTPDSTLGETIKYFASWFILIGAIAAFIALIYAGVLYLSSIGKPNIMHEAQVRILKSFLGLAILLGSYLILITINPQLIVLRAKKTPIVSGVILMNATGTTAILNAAAIGDDVPEEIEQCVSDKNAYYLRSNIKNCEQEFGELIVPDPMNPNMKNFKNFELTAIGMIESKAKNVKVIAYHKKDFEKEENNAEEYIYEGRIDQFGELILHEMPESVLWPNDEGGFEIMHLFINSSGNFPFYQENHGATHPPLSFEVKNIWPGTYLFADNIGEEAYLSGSESSLSNIDFNNKTKRISVFNEPKNENDREHDFLSILYQDKDFYSSFRMFFVKKEREMPGTTDNGNTWAYYNDESNPWYIPPGNLDNIEINFDWSNNSIRKTIESPEGSYTDQYGKCKKPSSVQVFEIDGDNPRTCQEVRICTKPNFSGSCIVYTPINESLNIIEVVDAEEGVFIATSSNSNHPDGIPPTVLPIYTPKNIPVTMDAIKIDEDGNTESATGQDRKFANNIFSIEIIGSCIVALFQNEVDDKTQINRDFWESKNPGIRSQVFTESVADLSDYEICRCGGWLGIGNFRYGTPCASAIAIYPKK